MSSSLNLTPDIAVVGIQAGLFLSNLWVVKKLMLEPYLKLREARDQQTSGNAGEAENLLQKAKELDLTISQKMRDAHKEASQTREKLKMEALSIRAAKITDAEKTAKSEQAALHTAILSNLSEEKSKKLESIAVVKSELIRLATHV